MDKMAERLNDICIRILQLVYLNILWIAFTLLGLVLAGIGPATLALYTVIRQWIRGNSDIPIFSTFWKAYRSSFKEASVIGMIYLVIGWILYVDLLYVQSFYLRALVIFVSFIYVVSLCYVFPIMVHYDWKSTIVKIKCSVLFGISYLQYTLIMLLSLAFIYFILFMNSGALVVFGVSIGNYVIMWMTNQVFIKVENQAVLLESESQS
ncbi:YesL family protein [Metabacillus halosaccharovorans]|uniref:YesL family protein n=1 Tax=Metabacillus halosaccharovorans TaxID=930124 RepID=UPI000995A4AB|nr:YesL family protein [Metabacillus halosaccharovorans]